MSGYELGAVVIDELDLMKKSDLVLRLAIERLRDKNGPLQIRISTTPNGFKTCYENFADDETKLPDSKMIKGSSTDNIHLPDGYIETMVDSFDEKMIEQPLHAGFVSVDSGRVYYGFDKNVHERDLTLRETDALSRVPHAVGVDFNVDIMACIVYKYWNNTIYIVDELKGINTDDLFEKIFNLYGNRIMVTCDPSGGARTTASYSTNFTVIENLGFAMNNPSRGELNINHWHSVNNILGKKRIVLVKGKAPKLSKELLRLTHAQIGKTGCEDHYTDCLKYVNWIRNPIKLNSNNNRNNVSRNGR